MEIKLECQCGFIWDYKPKDETKPIKRYVTCPSCYTKVDTRTKRVAQQQ